MNADSMAQAQAIMAQAISQAQAADLNWAQIDAAFSRARDAAWWAQAASAPDDSND